MEFIGQFFDIVLHLDQHLNAWVLDYGLWIYLLLFLIIFCETGLIVTPFLPGDSLLFVVGTLAGAGTLNIDWIYPLLCVAAVSGDTLNYSIGHYLGPKVLCYENSRLFNKAYLERTRAFYDRHGGKTLIIARFMPILRTFAPFVAGIGRMRFPRFISYSVLGGLLWVSSFVLGGYFFGALPVIKDNLTLFIFAIIGLSILPGVAGYWRGRARHSHAWDKRPR